MIIVVHCSTKTGFYFCSWKQLTKKNGAVAPIFPLVFLTQFVDTREIIIDRAISRVEGEKVEFGEGREGRDRVFLFSAKKS